MRVWAHVQVQNLESGFIIRQPGMVCISLATSPYFVTAHGGRRKVGSSIMCKFPTSK